MTVSTELLVFSATLDKSPPPVPRTQPNRPSGESVVGLVGGLSVPEGVAGATGAFVVCLVAIEAFGFDIETVDDVVGLVTAAPEEEPLLPDTNSNSEDSLETVLGLTGAAILLSLDLGFNTSCIIEFRQMRLFPWF